MNNSNCAFLFQWSSRAITNTFNRCLKNAKISVAQYIVLESCVFNAKENLSLNKLSVLLKMERTTLLRNLKVLIRKGLVKKTPNREDKRIVTVVATDAGIKKFEETKKIYQDLNEDICKSYGKKEYKKIEEEIISFVESVKSKKGSI